MKMPQVIWLIDTNEKRRCGNWYLTRPCIGVRALKYNLAKPQRRKKRKRSRKESHGDILARMHSADAWRNK